MNWMHLEIHIPYIRLISHDQVTYLFDGIKALASIILSDQISMQPPLILSSQQVHDYSELYIWEMRCITLHIYACMQGFDLFKLSDFTGDVFGYNLEELFIVMNITINYDYYKSIGCTAVSIKSNDLPWVQFIAHKVSLVL